MKETRQHYLVLAVVAPDLFGDRQRIVPIPRTGSLYIGFGERDELVRRGSDSELRIKGVRLSERHVQLRVEADELLHVKALSLSEGGISLNGRKVKEGQLAPSEYLEAGQTFFTYVHSEEEHVESATLGPTRSVDPGILAIVDRARRIAPSQTSVLIL